MNNMQIVGMCLLIMALTMKKTIGYSVLAVFGFALNGRTLDKEVVLLSVISFFLIVLQVTLLYILVTHMNFSLGCK